MREKLGMDFAWKFHLDNLDRPIPNNMMYYYLHTKAERGRGPAAASFYDGDWEVVDLPHDYAIAGGVDFSASDTEGFVPRQNGWYRRLFALSPEDEGKRIVLQFDGVSTHATVYVNGHLLYRNFCGYTSFAFEITEYVDYGDMLNEISVYVDTTDFEGWWYEGAGIYRHVWMIKTAPVAVENWGTYVDARKTAEEGAGTGRWCVTAETEIRSILYEETEVCVVNEILDAAGNCVAEARERLTAAPREVSVSRMQLEVKDPDLWSPEHPALYTMQTGIWQDDVRIDTYDTTFGFRTLAFTTEGMQINGKPVKLRGVCAHEDHANLGVAVPDAVREFRMKTLKEMGVSAYRCSHNPPTPEVLDLCDRLGIMVMDENRWFGCSKEDLDQLCHMMKRDRNHPCIVMWSMANEERIQGTERGQRIMSSMRHTARKYDVTRPIMMAMDGGCTDGSGAAGASDIIGINYQSELFDEIHARFPDIPLVSSEIGGKMLKYGIMGDGSGEDWESVNTRPYFMGMFKWVAFGYRGESRGWPRIYSRSGIIEPTGTPKENTWFYKQMWDEGDPFIKIWPMHWNHAGKEGEPVEVKVYSNAAEVELFLDGISLGRQQVNPYRRTVFSVTYQPGELRAVAYDDEAVCAEEVIRTTGAPVRLTLRQEQTDFFAGQNAVPADCARVCANRTDVIILSVGAEDAAGNPVYWSGDLVEFETEGPVQVLAVSNNDPYDTLGATELKRKLFGGICQLILRTTTEPGTIRVRACAKGRETAEYTAESVPCERSPHVAIETDTDAMFYFAKMDGPH